MNKVRENALHIGKCFIGLLIGLMYLVCRKHKTRRATKRQLWSHVKTHVSMLKIFGLIL